MEENYRRLHAKYNDYRDSTDSKPSVAKAKIIGDLNASLMKCLDLEIESLGNIEANQGTLYFKKSDHPKPFEFNVLSAGEKEAVDILLDLYLRKDDYDDTVFLIDEPELHINTAIQRKLLVEINHDRAQLPTVGGHSQRRLPSCPARRPQRSMPDHPIQGRSAVRLKAHYIEAGHANASDLARNLRNCSRRPCRSREPQTHHLL